MAPYWEPGTQYELGAVVEFEGVEYGIIQAHRSQGDWTPPVTPALWGRRQGHSGGHKEENHQQQQQQQQQQNQYQQEEQRHEEKNTFFGVEMSDNTEHKLKVGGGLALGAALLGGGIAAYKHHQDKEREHEHQGSHKERVEFEERTEVRRDYD
ncbi:hypothetical protein BDN72DRAFT_839388 [Pluteus cervinus]|uniref:Uncharacterized protein n=1 Tax=Pluteus cervinus TaxID=181527 RepID=A0ACD3AW06_9AGAR|nr:hypothetical protein BDN72DRAFT_839388 [Pluteus cervinus]